MSVDFRKMEKKQYQSVIRFLVLEESRSAPAMESVKIGLTRWPMCCGNDYHGR